MSGRNDRNEQFFGAEGQAKIQATSVAIVGLGGLGAPVAQQLAYLGVLDFSLIDHDLVTDSSLNRLVGAGPSDDGLLKVEIAARQIAFIQPPSAIRRIAMRLESVEAFDALRRADYVFGCLDHDGPRAVLVEYCQAYERPLFDLASDIDPEANPMTFGGRVYFINDGQGCPRCIEPGLDQGEINLYDKSTRDREAEDRAYGIRKRALAGGGPSVVSINGVLASLAVTEFMVQVTGIRAAARELQYRAQTGVVSRATPRADPNCYYCRSVRGTGDAADLARYIRAAKRAK